MLLLGELLEDEEEELERPVPVDRIGSLILNAEAKTLELTPITRPAIMVAIPILEVRLTVTTPLLMCRLLLILLDNAILIDLLARNLRRRPPALDRSADKLVPEQLHAVYILLMLTSARARSIVLVVLVKQPIIR